MAAPDLRSLVRIGYDILTTTVNAVTGKILAQLGDVHHEDADTDNAEWWQHVGIASRPSKPEAGKQSAQAVCIKLADHDVCIASQDMRGLDLYGNLGFGETCVYAAGETGTSQARAVWRSDGSINLFTTDDNTADGNAVFFRVAKDGFYFVAPWGTMKFDSSGFHVNHRGGAQLSLGAISGMPTPLDQISSYVRMQAGSFNVNASAQSMGGSSGHQPLANATAVKTMITALQTEVAALQAAVAALQADPTHTASAAATSTAATVVTAQAAIIAAQQLLVDTTSSST